MNTVSYTNGPTPQAIGAAMMPMDVQQAQQPGGGNPIGGVPQVSPQMMQQMMGNSGYSPGYVDASGVSGQTLAQNGIAPGPGALSGLLGLGQYQNMMGSACYG